MIGSTVKHPQSRNVFKEKKDRATFAGGPSLGRKRPGRAAAAGKPTADLILQIKKLDALTRLNFCSGLAFRMADISQVMTGAPTMAAERFSLLALAWLNLHAQHRKQ
jgi:hypothetical protein